MFKDKDVFKKRLFNIGIIVLSVATLFFATKNLKESPSVWYDEGIYIQSAVNLINFIRENYGNDQALDLERRLINSIKSQDPNKFIRGVRRHETNNENK